MIFSAFDSTRTRQVIELFTRVFGDSEGEAEGRLIGNLVSELITTTASDDLVGFVAISGDSVVGSIFFSRLFVPGDKVAFILSPVAIATALQGKGLGQRLIGHGVEQMKSSGVNWLFTYGDPAFYARVGFGRISEDVAKAPLRLSYPEGWLAQSLDGSAIEVTQGTMRCVKALDDQRYW